MSSGLARYNLADWAWKNDVGAGLVQGSNAGISYAWP